jgi:DNA-binding LacI/PurR family transcriptional regulator
VIPGDDEWLDRIVDSGMLDGALVIGQSNQMDAIERVAERYLPMVVWGSHRAGQIHCTVGTDNRLGGRLAAQRLLDQGKRRLVFFGDTGAPEIADRLAGAQEAVAACPGAAAIVACSTHLSNEEIPEQVAGHLNALGQQLDGIVCASDVIAMTTCACCTNAACACRRMWRSPGSTMCRSPRRPSRASPLCGRT